MTTETRDELSRLALTLRRQAAKLEAFPGEHGEHIHGMRAGLLLASVEIQQLATRKER